MLSITDADRILQLYHLPGRAQSVTPLQETIMNEERRLIYRVETSNGGQWVCRLTRETAFPRRLIEQQSQFAIEYAKTCSDIYNSAENMLRGFCRMYNTDFSFLYTQISAARRWSAYE